MEGPIFNSQTVRYLDLDEITDEAGAPSSRVWGDRAKRLWAEAESGSDLPTPKCGWSGQKPPRWLPYPGNPAMPCGGKFLTWIWNATVGEARTTKPLLECCTDIRPKRVDCVCIPPW